MKKLPILILLILLIPFAFAQKRMTLLAVSETDDGLKGATAELFLEIRPGSGNVFIATYPLSKLDTQISTRFAKNIACKNLNIDCSVYDFFYTIRGGSAIIGGLSGGAAITIITIAQLDNLDIKEDLTITGTINSGGFIGPVGGLKEKIEVAAKSGIKTVLIPKGETFSNKTRLEEIKKENGINIIEVSELDEAVFYLTGKEYKKIEGKVIPDKKYKEIMYSLAKDLCDRSVGYSKNIKTKSSIALNLTEKGLYEIKNENYYSAGSFCFGANTQYQRKILEEKKLGADDILKLIRKKEENIINMSSQLDNINYKSLTDLETYMIVKERIINAYDLIQKSQEYLLINDTENSIYNLAFANERLYSAYLWAKFFGIDKEKINLDKELIKESCLQKISEAKESHQYVKIYFPEALEKSKKEIDRAEEDMQNGDYELCLFKASKAKAEANIVLNVYGVEENQVEDIIKQKLDIVRKNIIKEQRKGRFPIVGYSYYEYAQNLIDSDLYSALLYVEYALELSNLDIYFNKKNKAVMKENNIELEKKILLILTLLSGAVIGSFITLLILKKRLVENKHSKKEKKKRRKKKQVKSKTQARFRRIPQGKKR